MRSSDRPISLGHHRFHDRRRQLPQAGRPPGDDEDDGELDGEAGAGLVDLFLPFFLVDELPAGDGLVALVVGLGGGVVHVGAGSRYL